MAGFIAFKKIVSAKTNKPIVAKLFVPTAPCPELPKPINNLMRNNVVNKDYAKFRCNGVRVISGEGESVYTRNNILYPQMYAANKWIYPHEFGEDLDNACAPGIHFFLTRDAAKHFLRWGNPPYYDGEYKRYNDDGCLIEKCTFKGRKFHGVRECYHMNGKISLRYQYVDGLLHGKCDKYDEQGILIASNLYMHDCWVESLI